MTATSATATTTPATTTAMTQAPPVDASTLVALLGRRIPGDRLFTDADVVASLSADDAEWAPVGTPLLALRARTEDDVRHALVVGARFRVRASEVSGCMVLILGVTSMESFVRAVEEWADRSAGA